MGLGGRTGQYQCGLRPYHDSMGDHRGAGRRLVASRPQRIWVDASVRPPLPMAPSCGRGATRDPSARDDQFSAYQRQPLSPINNWSRPGHSPGCRRTPAAASGPRPCGLPGRLPGRACARRRGRQARSRPCAAWPAPRPGPVDLALRAAATARRALLALQSAATRAASSCSVVLCSVEVLEVSPPTGRVSVSALAVSLVSAPRRPRR